MEYKYTGAWHIFPSDNGPTWILGYHSGSYGWAQAISPDGQRLLGDEGFYMQRCPKLFPDDTSGCWLLWETDDSLRVKHYDQNGRSWQNLYPENGFGLYEINRRWNGEKYSIVGGKLDQQSERLWLSLNHKFFVFDEEMPTELVVQVLGDEWVSINTPNLTDLPQTFALMPAFPNPFNSSTTINCSIPLASDVSLKMYDLSGQFVSKLFSGRKTAGNFSILWEALDCPAGVYFCQMQAGSFIETRKLILMK